MRLLHTAMNRSISATWSFAIARPSRDQCDLVLCQGHFDQLHNLDHPLVKLAE